MDPDDARQRNKGRLIGLKRQKDEWLAQLQDLPVTEDVVKNTVIDLTDSDHLVMSEDESESENSDSNESMPANVSLDHSAIDASVLAMSQVLSGAATTPEDFANAIDSLVLDSKVFSTTTRLPTGATEFIVMLSKCNVYRNEVCGDVMPEGAVSGGSRDMPSRWRYLCVNAPTCSMTFTSRYLRDKHGETCKPGPRVVHPFACEDCDASFQTQSGLNTHVKHVHGEWIPIGCDEEGCTSTEVFQTRGAFLCHRQDFHSVWTPQKCAKCPDRPTFQTRRSLTQHIRYHHPHEKAELMPPKTKTRKRNPLAETVSWVTSVCLFPGCEHGNTYATRDKYMQHLRILHGVKAADSAPYMPTMSENE